MKNLILFSLAFAFLTACINPNNQQQNTAQESETAPPTEPKTCYAFTNGKDSIKMSLILVDQQALGDLSYNYFEKDANNGSFMGRMVGDTLYANYTFISEGIESHREIAFLKRNNEMIEGFGDVVEQNGRFLFKNRSGLKFENSFVLKKVTCED